MPLTAYFDFDDTLIAGDSDDAIHAHTRALGRLTPEADASHRAMIAAHRAGTLTMESFCAFLRTRVRGWTPADYTAAAVACFHVRARPRLFPDALDWLAWHRGQGHRTVIVSGGTAPLIAEAGRHLQCDAAYGADVVARNGAYTHAVREPVPYRQGKIAVAAADAAAAGCDLRNCWFYSDSVTDVPLLERVGHAVVVHPGGELAALAAARGWRVERPTAPAGAAAEPE